MKNLKLKFAHFSILVVIALSLFTASCEDNEVSLTCADLDYIALRALYLSTDGDSWTTKAGWLTAAEFEANPTIPAGTDVGTWYGVTTDTDGCVSRLEVGVNNLSGHIPAELGNLSSLEYLGLTFNNLSGHIPPELGNLNNLIRIELFGNELSGHIPPELGNLSNIFNLNLGFNQLEGGIPPELGNLSTLSDLFLGSNQLEGSIPAELGNLSNLGTLTLFNNQLSGCYDSNLNNLCTGWLLPGNNNISNGNNFDAPWEDFCATGAGACTP